MRTLTQDDRAVNPAPVRHGTCKLRVEINGAAYAARPGRSNVRGLRLWTLRKLEGERPVYAVGRSEGRNVCTCPDYEFRSAECKHIRALVALGLLSNRRRRPSEGGIR